MSKNSKCKNCTGGLFFNADKNMLECSWCGSQFPVKEKKNSQIRRAYTSSYSPIENQDVELGYKCSTCGTKLMAGTEDELTRCTSCGNSTLVREKSILKIPDGIIPFEISRSKAAEIFNKWVGKRKFAPSDLKQLAKLEKISGIYTPVWNFSYSWAFKYSAVGVKKFLDDYDREVRREYFIQKVVEDNCDNDIYAANSRMNNEMGVQFHDYNFEKVRPYSSQYLYGYTGFDTDLDIHKIYNQLEVNIKNSVEQKVKNELEEDYDFIEDFTSIVKLRNTNFSYAFVPVWANHYTYKGKEYHCYINGQTGSASGSSPKSAGKILGTIFGVLGGIGALILLISSLL